MNTVEKKTTTQMSEWLMVYEVDWEIYLTLLNHFSIWISKICNPDTINVINMLKCSIVLTFALDRSYLFYSHLKLNNINFRSYVWRFSVTLTSVMLGVRRSEFSKR